MKSLFANLIVRFLFLVSTPTLAGERQVERMAITTSTENPGLTGMALT